MSRSNRPPPKDMYWFAHGGSENEKNLLHRNGVVVDGEENHISGSPTWNMLNERRSPEEQRFSPNLSAVDGGSNSSGPSSLDERLQPVERRITVEERKKNLWEAEQERNDAALKKRLEREAALEARRNASRSNIAFAFGSSVPRNVESLHVNEMGDSDLMSRSFTAGGLSPKAESYTAFDSRRSVSPILNSNEHSFVLNSRNNSSHNLWGVPRVLSPSTWLTGSGALIGDDIMTRSMSAAISPAARGRRKNDLMPTVPYDRHVTPRATTSSSTRKRSVSMTRLDQLAQPRRHYLEANKANSTANGGASSALKDNIRSPNRPLSSASEHSGGTGRAPGNVTLRMRSSPRKPRPISIAGTVPDLKLTVSSCRPSEMKVSSAKRNFTPKKKTEDTHEARKAASSTTKAPALKSVEKVKHTPRSMVSSSVTSSKSSTSKATTPKSKVESKPVTSKPSPASKAPTPKAKDVKAQANKKKTEPVIVVTPTTNEVKSLSDDYEKNDSQSSSVDLDVAAENEKNNAKRIISEDEARAALAEKRRLAREQAEKEAELERQRLEELRREEEERLRLEEEEQRKMEEEQLRLLEEHRRQEEEKLRKAIEDQEQKEEEERTKRDEEMRLKAEQEKKSKEEAEKQRIELEEKLRKEEEERAERKKRLEKIMSRTRGKSSNTSPSGSVSGSDQLDSGENAHEGFSSGANSLDSNEAVELPSDHATMDDHHLMRTDNNPDSLEANPTYEVSSDNGSLNSNDLMMPLSETASQDNSLVMVNEKINTNVEGYSAPLPEEETDLMNTDGNEYYSSNMPVIEDIQNDFLNLNLKSNYSSEVGEETKIETSQIEFVGGQAMEEIHSAYKADFASDLSDNKVLQQVESQVLENEYESKVDQMQVSEAIMQYEDTYSSGESSNLADAKDLTDSFNSVSETQPQYSVSSDIKLPDPIYETSEDGSVSSEKQQDTKLYEDFDDTKQQENTSIMDDVFSEHGFLPDPVSAHQSSPGFSSNLNPFAEEFVFQTSEDNSNQQQDLGKEAFDTPDPGTYRNQTDILQQQFGVEKEDDIRSQSSASSVVEAEVYEQKESEANDPFFQDDKENIVSGTSVSNASLVNNESVSTDLYAEKENIFSTENSMQFGAFNVPGESGLNLGPTGDNPLVGVSRHFSEGFESNSMHFQLEDADPKGLEESLLKSEVLSSTEHEKVDDVTFIQSNDNGACIGIISSLDHDHTVNDFPSSKRQSERFKSNFESASMTDSEDNSSLDSNLSQVMTVENGETSTAEGLTETERNVQEPNGLVYSNGGKHNPFDSELSFNDENVSKQNVNNFNSELFSNGHGLDTSKQAVDHIADYVQGSDILSVDSSKNNIFESVDAIDYNSKVTQDHPFLAKGGSNQIPGNPFLLQDEKKQSIITTDFFN